MARTEVKSTQIKQLTLLIDDLRDFGSEDGGSLNLNVKAGRIRDDNTITDKASQVVALTDNATNFVELSIVGVASANTSAFTAGSIPIATVVTSGGSISTITDKRAWVAVDNAGAGGGGAWEFVETVDISVSGTSGTLPTDTLMFMLVWDEVHGTAKLGMRVNGNSTANKYTGFFDTGLRNGWLLTNGSGDFISGILWMPQNARVLNQYHVRVRTENHLWTELTGVPSGINNDAKFTDIAAGGALTSITIFGVTGGLTSGKIHIYKLVQ